MRVVLACVVGVLLLSSSATAARAPTGAEKRTVVAVFNDQGRGIIYPARCLRVRVSTVNERYAMVTSPRRIPTGCYAGNGFELYVRPSVGSLTWRQVPRPCVPRLRRIIRDVWGDCF